MVCGWKVGFGWVGISGGGHLGTGFVVVDTMGGVRLCSKGLEWKDENENEVALSF